MVKNRFLISWIVSAVLMYTISYAWHGLLLNDFVRLTYPLNIYLLLSAIVYLSIGFIITALNNSFEIEKLKKKSSLKGLFFGVVVGAFVYLLAFVFGISFYSTPRIEHVILDFAWQIIEQGAGGLCCGLIFVYYERVSRIMT